MKNTLRSSLAIFLVFSLLTGCQSRPSSASSSEELELDESDATGAPSPDVAPATSSGAPEVALPADNSNPSSGPDLGIKACAQHGTDLNFNDQRIVGFQKLISIEVLKIKAKPMTQESTQELAMLETLNRRVSAPLLTPRQRVAKVSEILSSEAKNLIAILEYLRKNDPTMGSTIQEAQSYFIKHINNQDHWNCIEKSADFVKDPIEEVK